MKETKLKILSFFIILGFNIAIGNMENFIEYRGIYEETEAYESSNVYWFNPRQMFFLDSITGWIVGEKGVVLKTTDGGSQWIDQSLNITNNVYYVFFVNKNVGWVCGQNGMIWKTVNGGNSWTQQKSFTNLSILSMYFVDTLKGWAACGDSGIVLSTTNGGNSWNKYNTGIDVQLRNTVFVNEKHGWICGDSGVIIHTTNGGIEWKRQDSGTNTYLWWIDFADTLHGFCVGGRYTDNSTIFLKTTNGGETWLPQILSSAPLFGTDLLNCDTGWIAGRYGKILKTTNGGESWISQDFDGHWIAQITFPTAEIGYCLTGETILICTTNGGNDWFIKNVAVSEPFKSTLSIFDVPNDNGKQVFARWYLSQSPAKLGITKFHIYRYDLGAWTYLFDVPVLEDNVYQVIVPTLYDSTKKYGVYYSVFKVIAKTSVPYSYITIGPDSGYSVDNLPPRKPRKGMAIKMSDGNVKIMWDHAEDTCNDVKEYMLYKASNPNFVTEPSTRLAVVNDTFYVDYGAQGDIYYYKITSADYSGNESEPLDIVLNMSVKKITNDIPLAYNLSQNYPNPFNLSTEIRFSLKNKEYVNLKVFDLSGKEIETLISNTMEAGTYSVNFNARNLSSGMYLYQLQTNSFVLAKKMLLLK